ncbi:MAG TPA: hypothetical protein VLL97_13645 [Acidobacteriota bacterium]|nr:hypothetical protein [Acidobacteriota bacterium]
MRSMTAGTADPRCLTGAVPLHAIIMDTFIESFHRVTGLTSNRRNDFRMRDTCRIESDMTCGASNCGMDRRIKLFTVGKQ